MCHAASVPAGFMFLYFPMGIDLHLLYSTQNSCVKGHAGDWDDKKEIAQVRVMRFKDTFARESITDNRRAVHTR